MVRTREIQLNLEMMAFKHHDGSTSSRKRDREATLYPESSSSSSSGEEEEEEDGCDMFLSSNARGVSPHLAKHK